MKIRCIIMAITFLYSCAIGENLRWWQREDLKPSTNQIINPDYITKKRELEIRWDERSKAIEAIEYFASKNQNTSAIKNGLKDIEKEIEKLELVLKDISPYIDKTAIPQSSDKNENDHNPIINAHDITTYGNRVMFRLDLSYWSTSKLIEFTNDFQGTEGALYFGIRILPSNYVIKQFKRFESKIKTAKELGISPSDIVDMDGYPIYTPAVWPENESDQKKEIELIEKTLIKGEAVLIPLIYNGDDVSIQLPKGIYFLNYIMCTKYPTKFSKQTLFAQSNKIERCSFGPYYIKVDGKEQSAVTYTPKPPEITHDDIEKYILRLQDIGVDSLIMDSFLMNIPVKEEAKEGIHTEQNTLIKIRCLSCGQLNPEDANFCQKCGSKLVSDTNIHEDSSKKENDR